jgi:glycine reductase
MPLTVQTWRVREVRAAAQSRFADGRLDLDLEALCAWVCQRQPGVQGLNVHLAHPGESVRLLCCKDVVQPRARVLGQAPGDGVLAVLDGVAVVTCGPIVGFQEGIIDMSGPGAAYTPFSQLHLVALEVTVAPRTPAHQHEAILRGAGLDASAYLAGLCRDTDPDGLEIVSWNERPVDAALPRVAYVCIALTQGLLHDTYLFGENARDRLPLLLDPRALLDNAVVSGNCVSACDKNTTFHHQNNPLVRLLLEGHGRRWNFVGLVLTQSPVRLADKEQAARDAVALVQGLEAQGAVVSKEGFGNPDADLMMILRGLEGHGIRSVALTDEFAGADGGSQSLADTAAEADVVVSTGNANARIRLPAMQRVIGPVPDVARLAGGYAGCIHADGSLEVELQALMGSTNELGFSSLSCREI